MGVYKRTWSNNRPSFAVKTRVVYNDGLWVGDKDSSYREVAPGRAPWSTRPDNTDDDGLTDEAEAMHGPLETRVDTDSDGLDDETEVDFWGDSWDADADHDGRINVLDADSDNDGVTDGAEVDQDTNPAKSPTNR